MRKFALMFLVACGGPTTVPDETDTLDLREEFACEELTCAATQYCHVVVGGAQPPEGEDGIHPSCLDFPAACADDPTCACLVAEDVCGAGSDCAEQDGGPRCTLNAP